MRVEVRSDSVVIDGYVNAVERYSKLLPSVKGKFKEKIQSGAFNKSLERRSQVDLLLNHDKNRKLGSVADGNLELFEDNIGLRAICTVTDTEVVEKARSNRLKGWSFGFFAEKDNWTDTEEGYSKRIVEELDLFEVSIIDDTKSPAYASTSIETREEEEILKENRITECRAVTVSIEEAEKRTDPIDYSSYDNEIDGLLKTLNK